VRFVGLDVTYIQIVVFHSLKLCLQSACIRFAEYDNDIYTDGDMVLDIDDNADSQLSEITPQLNHVGNKINGDLENDLDASVTVKQRTLVGANTVRRQSSVGAVNGLKTHDHNIILQRMAVVEVKKPGKGNMSCRCENMLRYVIMYISNKNLVLLHEKFLQWKKCILLLC